MAVIIGMDEAGYGPNLGPLVVAASVWRTPDELGACDLYPHLADCVCRDLHANGRLAIADSKQLYKPGGRLTYLELAVYASLAAKLLRPADWRGVLASLLGEIEPTLRDIPWYADYNEPAPLDCAATDVDGAVQLLAGTRGAGNIALLDIQAVAIFPSEFNRRVQRLDSKGALLTEATLRLARQMIERHTTEQIYVQCDKHGGRNRYAGPLQHVWPEGRLRIVCESRAESAYRIQLPGSNAKFRFSVGGEAQLPAALASMTAKYVRELTMRAFNAFWRRHLPGIRPTAGYPLDARRFRREIAAVQYELGIADDVHWRDR